MSYTLQQYYVDTSWGDHIRTIHIISMAIYYITDWNHYGSEFTLLAMLNSVASNDRGLYCDECEPNMFCASCLGQSNYFEVDYADYLTKCHRFSLWESAALSYRIELTCRATAPSQSRQSTVFITFTSNTAPSQFHQKWTE